MDIIKHMDIFDPSKVEGNIGIAGVGASGSALALTLAKLGFEDGRITLFDDDKVEAHNISNQLLYGPRSIGRYKVTEATAMIETLTGFNHICVLNKLTHKDQLSYYGITTLFVCVDSMAARKDIFENCIKRNIKIKLLIDGRMGARGASVTSIQNTDKGREYYEQTLYNDDDTIIEKAACGTVLSIGATAMALASQMTWAYMNACNSKEGCIRDLETHYQNPAMTIIDGQKTYSR